MNDPGTAEPIARAAAEMENPTSDSELKKEEQKARNEEERDYADPNLYWFESTACPLLAATFGPIASAFNICALSSNWRVYIPPEGTEEHGTVIIDPTWLLAINGLSLGAALIANGALLLSMARRLRFAFAMPVIILGFTLGSALLIADLIAITASHTYQIPASSPAAPASHHALTEAFYYGIMAAAIYFIISFLMCWTVFGVFRGHYGRHFNLTTSQRTLMLQTMMFMTYLLLGALVFSHIEGWEYLVAVYWADVTLLTVGLGDYSPTTRTGRGLLIPFAIGGIVIIGLVIGSIRTLILERGQKKISARMLEKRRVRAVNSVDPRKNLMHIGRFKTMHFDESFGSTAHKREQEFKVMRIVQDIAERDRRWLALAISTTAACVLWFAGSAIFMVAENNQQWTYFQALYFSYLCLLTIGYGDLEPMSNSGRSFFVLWSLLAVPTLTILISDMGDTVVSAFSNATMWIGSLTVLPGETGFRAQSKSALKQLSANKLKIKDFQMKVPPGFLSNKAQEASGGAQGGNATREEPIKDGIAERLALHLEAEELHEAEQAADDGDAIERDIHFYHFVLARECQRLMRDLNATPPKRYQWSDWEYFLHLMANEPDYKTITGQRLVPDELRYPESSEEMERKHQCFPWSWLSSKSPLMGHQTETEWILERLGACLEKELKESRVLRGKDNPRKRPPISMEDMLKRGRQGKGSGSGSGSDTEETRAALDGAQEKKAEIERMSQEWARGNEEDDEKGIA